MDPLRLAQGVDVVAQTLAWALPRLGAAPVLVYATAGVQSAKLCRVLYKKGYTQLYNLAGGYLVWRTSNMPIEKPR